MTEIMYDPDDVGKEVLNNRGKLARKRKYHMTEKEQKIAREKWELETKDVPKRIKKLAGPYFYNPYRKGIYYYQIYSMYLLGSNKWHKLSDIISNMQKIMTKKVLKKDKIEITAWEKFVKKSSREDAVRCKDFVGRIQENMVFFQRLTKLHPTGYKLRQVRSAIDMKRISKIGFPGGIFFYRLSTYSTIEEALPIRDFKEFDLLKYKSRYVNYRFIGTIITKDKIIQKGHSHALSQV